MNGKKPTVEQRKFLEARGFDSNNYLIQKDTPKFMQIVDKQFYDIRIVDKSDNH